METYSQPGQPRTFEDLLAAAEHWTDLLETSRRVLKAHIRTAAFIVVTTQARACGRTDRVHRGEIDLTSIPCDVPFLNKNLFGYSAAVYGLSARGYDNTITGVRRILRGFNMIEPYEAPVAPGGAWSRLFDALDREKYCEMALTRFAGWCQAQGISPDRVGRQTLVRYEKHVRSRHLRDDIPGLIRGIAKAWRKAPKISPDWPSTPLAAPRQP